MSQLSSTWPTERELTPQEREVVQSATAELRRMIEPNDEVDVAATWSVSHPGQPDQTLKLRLADPYARVEQEFRLAELTDRSTWFRLSRLYDRLLSRRVKVLLGRATDNDPVGAA
ncbi:MAG: hypothetical protein U0871_13080 [Gemmataceae bacterium]